MIIDSQIPKYYQIANEIINDIRSGKIVPGEKILSENEIIKHYNVSNTTARKVLLEIEKEGWVIKVKGKGTFVKETTIDRSASKILSFTKNMRQSGLTPTTRLLNSEIIYHPVSNIISSRKYTLQPPSFKITRLRFANDIAVMKEDRYISMKYCPEIEKLNMEDSLYDIYKERFGLVISEIDQVINAVLIEGDLLSHFSLKKPVPGFKIDGVTFCGKEMILEIEESIYRGDKYKFTVQATP